MALEQEKELLAQFAHNAVNVHLPLLLKIELKHLPDAAEGLAELMLASLQPKLLALLNADIDQLLASKGA